ncbi:MAG: DUF4258 domain-containing protein [archaeon]
MAIFAKNLNKDYNYHYNKDKKVRFHKHFLFRKKHRNVNLDIVFETLETGRINSKKSKGTKLCVERFFGKTNQTCVLIVNNYERFIEVKTVWFKKGK